MRKSRILIASGNRSNLGLLEERLAHVDCEIAVADDGHDTLAKAESFGPDLILLESVMPKLSGFDVCRTLKQNPATKGILVLMLATRNELADIERAVDAGTDGYMSSPINEQDFAKHVAVMLRLRDASG